MEKLSRAAFFSLFDLSEASSLYRDFESPDDRKIWPDDEIHFIDGPVFYTKAACPQDDVTITIDGKEYPIKSGQSTVKAIKDMASVKHGDELVQIINGDITPLEDGGSVCIEGGEVFVSHPRQGGSS
ncbi:MAG: hypothetical protein CML13_06715 [Puniceicoccaceae bacterium]|nr:hypothetical protein [Puniceicoccaceae bacterium]